VVIAQADIWWANLDAPTGSEPGFRRPVLVVQGDAFNATRLATTVVIPLTSNLKWAEAPGNVLLRAKETGLLLDSVANVSQIVALDKSLLAERAGRVRPKLFGLVLSGVDVMLGRGARGGAPHGEPRAGHGCDEPH